MVILVTVLDGIIKMKLNIKDIKPNPKNPRVIKDDKFKKLVQSLKDFPEMADVREVVVNTDHVVLGGNMRLKAMKEAGWKEIPVKIVDWTQEQQDEFVIKDNSSYGEWDWDELANQYDFEELEMWGIDFPKDMLGGDDDTEVVEDESPEVDEKEPPKSITGEIYALGNHRVMCGSATSEDDINLLMGDQLIDLLVTDPPYNVDYTGKTKDALKIDNDKMDDTEFASFLTDANRRVDEHMKAGAAFYIFHADSEGYNFRASVRDTGWLLKQCLIWVKQSMVMGRQDYQWKHEPILYGWKSGSAHFWNSDRKQTTVLNFDRPSRNADHPTMKPIAILAYLINNSSKAGDLVFDSFLGSGSTMVACEQTGRTCYGTELDPRYVDVIRKRYWKLTHDDDETGWEDGTAPINKRKNSK